jgi:putative heme-binding domain-containing protein
VNKSVFISASVLMVVFGMSRLKAGEPSETVRAEHRAKLRQFALNNNGDVARGRSLLFGKTLACIQCHDLRGDRAFGGPSLRSVADHLSREEIIEQILEPARRGKGRSIQVEFKTGHSTEYLLLEEGRDTLKVRDKKTNAIRTLDKKDLETFTRMQSDMPEGMVDHLTPEQFADVIGFLVNSKKSKGGPTDQTPLKK